jgi:cytochrome c553
MKRLAVRLSFLIALAGQAHLPTARAESVSDGVRELVIELGPITGVATSTRRLSFNVSARKRTTWYDVQDALEHHVRGVSLPDLLAATKAPAAADTVVFDFSDGMEIPVRLRDTEEVKAIFIALEHGDPMDVFNEDYRLQDRASIPCPKIVYGRPIKQYSIWLYPTTLTRIRVVSWKAYEALLAQPTRQLPDRSGWPLYLRHCQPCHGLGGQGAKRAPDLLGDMEAYRRVPPLAVTDLSQHPSLHEKVKGFTEGTMPVLNHISNQEIATLWRWLHTIHRGATK